MGESMPATPEELQQVIDAAVQEALRVRDAQAQAAVEAQQAAEEQAAQEASERADQELAAQIAENRRWEGHTHEWGPVDDAGVRTCTTEGCGLVLPPETIGEPA